MFALQSPSGASLLATVSRGGIMEVPTPVVRGEDTVDEPTRYPYDMIERMTPERRGQLRIVSIELDPYPTDPDVDVAENPLAKIDGVWRLTYSTTPRVVDLGALRVAAHAAIDTAAEAARMQFITPGAGQAMTYQRKLEEARLLQDGAPGPFPLLEASVGPDGEDIDGVADTVIAANAAWTGIGAAIEGVRLHGKQRVTFAGTSTAIATVRQLAIAGLAAIGASGGAGVSAIVSEALADLAAAAPEPD